MVASDELRHIFMDGFVDDARVWRGTLLIPGRWEVPTHVDTANFLAALSEDHKERGWIPLPLLFRPLAAKRLRLIHVPIDLWQIALNVNFDVGILDIFSKRTTKYAFGKQALRTSHRMPYIRAKVPDLTSRRTISTSPLPAPDVPRVMLRDLLPTSFEEVGGKMMEQSELNSASAIGSVFGIGKAKLSNDAAIELGTLCLGLSCRDNGRLRILYPDDHRALVPGSAPALSKKISQIIQAPSVKIIDRLSLVTLSVAYETGLYRVTARVAPDGVRLERAERLAAIRSFPSEFLVGPVRISNAKRPVRPTVDEEA